MKYSLIVLLIFTFFSNLSAHSVVDLWHAYRGREKLALERIVYAYNLSHRDTEVQLLAVPFDAYSDKLCATIPLGNGPDIFIAGASGISDLAMRGLIVPIDAYVDISYLNRFEDFAAQSVSVLYPDAIWGLPSNVKTLVLFYNRNLLNHPPRQTSELFRIAKSFNCPTEGQFGRWGLMYEIDNFYYHALWFHAWGGRILRLGGVFEDGTQWNIPNVYSRAFIESAVYVRKNIVESGLSASSVDRHLITHLFNTGNALMVINGQWFRGEIDSRINYGVSILPTVTELSRPLQPYVNTEVYLLSACAKNQKVAVEVMKYLTEPAMNRVMVEVAGQTPVCRSMDAYPAVRDDPIQKVFRKQASLAVKVPGVSEMLSVWSTGGALGAILNGKNPTNSALEGQKRLLDEISHLERVPKDYSKYTNFIN